MIGALGIWGSLVSGIKSQKVANQGTVYCGRSLVASVAIESTIYRTVSRPTVLSSESTPAFSRGAKH